MEILALVRRRVAVIFIGFLCSMGGAYAAPLVFSGNLGDSANTALVGSGALPAAPGFADMWEVANNVALYSLSVANAGNVEFKSLGFAAGGVDPYFTLFSGLGLSATFLASNYDNAGGGDFVLSLALAAGDYTIALGDFFNMSFAENLGSGVLGDGFVSIGSPDSLGDASYTLVVTLPASGGGSVPEPAALLLMLTGIAAMWRVMAKVRPSKNTV
jgi:hypothetical protein